MVPAHIRIHRLPSGDSEEDRAEHRESNGRRRMNQIDQSAVRTDCLENRRFRNDPAQAEDADRKKPQQHQRPEDVADEGGALALDQEQAN